MKRFVMRAALILLGLFVLIQVVPYGRAHENPPVTAEPKWDSPATRALAGRACFNCHSNETKWPWYAWVAPMSWLTQSDVDEGRGKMNLSEWNRAQEDAGEAAEQVEEGEMPPWYYLPAHPEAKLTADEKAQLIKGLKATVGEEGSAEEEREGKED